MATLMVDGTDLVVRLSPLEKLAAFRGDVRVPLHAVRSAQAEPDPWSALRGIRAPGTGIPGVIAYGTRRFDGGPDFAAVLGGPAVRVDLDGESPFARLVVSVADPGSTVAAIRGDGDLNPLMLDLEAARDRTIPDVLPEPGAVFRVLFCGINPGLYSAATGWHFARPGNRFWPALYLSGFTPRQLAPREQDLLPGWGLGITNLVARATAQAAELDSAELRAGREHLAAIANRHRPRIVAIAGVTAYRTAFGHPRASMGPQPGSLSGARLWVLPNPSGLNASWTIPKLTEAFRDLRLHVEG